jgi:hypothetical protein
MVRKNMTALSSAAEYAAWLAAPAAAVRFAAPQRPCALWREAPP